MSNWDDFKKELKWTSEIELNIISELAKHTNCETGTVNMEDIRVIADKLGIDKELVLEEAKGLDIYEE